jgi:hypothetical protein
VRDTATTGAPALAKAVAIPRPKPRLAPTTIVVLPESSLPASSKSCAFSVMFSSEVGTADRFAAVSNREPARGRNPTQAR